MLRVRGGCGMGTLSKSKLAKANALQANSGLWHVCRAYIGKFGGPAARRAERSNNNKLLYLSYKVPHA